MDRSVSSVKQSKCCSKMLLLARTFCWGGTQLARLPWLRCRQSCWIVGAGPRYGPTFKEQSAATTFKITQRWSSWRWQMTKRRVSKIQPAQSCRRLIWPRRKAHATSTSSNISRWHLSKIPSAKSIINDNCCIRPQDSLIISRGSRLKATR